MLCMCECVNVWEWCLQWELHRTGGSEIFGGGAGVSDGPAHTECQVKIVFVCMAVHIYAWVVYR